MKWVLKLAVGGLSTGLLVYLLHVYPFVWPLLIHRPRGWLHTLMVDYITANATPGDGVDYVVVVGFALAILLVDWLYTKCFSTNNIYGSSSFMNWREAGRFTTPLLPWLLGLLWWLFRLPFLLTIGTLQGVGLIGRSIHIQQQNTQTSKATASSRFVLGSNLGRTVFLDEKQQQEHVIMTAPTGSGKSSQVIIPNLLREEGGRSEFIADLMDELYPICAGVLALSHQVWRFAPTNPQESMGYNPLTHIEGARDAWMLGDGWVKNTGQSKDPYWDLCAALVISSLAMHIREVEPDAPFSRLSDLIAEMSYDQLKDLLTNSSSEPARRFAGPFVNYMAQNERLVGSVMTSIIVRFQMMNSDDVRTTTAKNEIDFNRMVEMPTSLFLSIPADETEYHKPLLACFTMQMFRAWRKRANKNRSRRLPRQVACYLDEFANVGYIPDFPKFISTARHFGVCLFLAIQNFSQLSALYGREGEETILNNAKTHLVFPGTGLRETEYYSKRMGETTVKTQTHTTTGTGSYAQDSWTQGETGRHLMTPDEIRTMPPRTILMVPAAFKVLLLKAKPYYEDWRLSRLANLPFAPQWIRVQPEPTPTPSFSSKPAGLSSPQQTQGGTSSKQTQSKGNSSSNSSMPQDDDNDEQYFLKE